VLPEECSLGVNPTNAAMLAPPNRLQSPISTANANPVRVETPRGHPNRRTTGVSSLSAAMVAISVSSRSRRALVATTVS
jgi:hypothetical protein